MYILKILGISITTSELLNNPVSQKQLLEALPDYGQFILLNLLAQIPVFEEQIKTTEALFDKILPESDSQIRILMSQAGIGIVFSRTIKTEILDIKYFSDDKYLVSYSGLAPVL